MMPSSITRLVEAKRKAREGIKAAKVLDLKARLERDRGFADSPLEQSGFELPVPLSRNGPPAAPAGSPCSNRRDRADAAVVLTPKVGPAVRIRFPPAASLSQQ